jgi:hypothetical protein
MEYAFDPEFADELDSEIRKIPYDVIIELETAIHKSAQPYEPKKHGQPRFVITKTFELDGYIQDQNRKTYVRLPAYECAMVLLKRGESVVIKEGWMERYVNKKLVTEFLNKKLEELREKIRAMEKAKRKTDKALLSSLEKKLERTMKAIEYITKPE